MPCPGGAHAASMEAQRQLQVEQQHLLALAVHEAQHPPAVPVIDNQEVGLQHHKCFQVVCCLYR